MDAMTTLGLALAATTAKTIGTVVFVAIWIAVVVRLLTSRSNRYREAAEIPLHDEPVTPRDGAQGEHSHG